MRDFPVIKFTLLFVAGIIFSEIFPLGITLNFILIGFLLLFLFAVYFFERRNSSYFITSLILLLFALCLGYTDANLDQKGKAYLPDSLYTIKNFTAYGVIDEMNLPHQDGFTFLLSTDSIKTDRLIKVRTMLLCRDNNTDIYNSLYPGNKIKISGVYRKGREKRNPWEFDYNKYLHSKNISGIVYADSSSIVILSKDYSSYEGLIFDIRKEIDNTITKLHTKETSALLRGLILADRSNINYEIKNQFINAGVVHILAVSGLHLGFIALIFYVIFGRLNLYFRSLLTVIGVLIFMFITGVPPSVFRASVMTIVIISAFLLNRTTNIYNSLALAALVILTINPSELFTPGFQLSFSAVLSIAYFYPVFKGFIAEAGINNKIINNILLFGAVSLSAQIGTLPFTLTYFGKLSLISILTNLLVIPLTALILGTALVSLGFYPLSIWAASVYASANNLFSELLYKIVEFAGSVKYSVIETSSYSLMDILFFYVFILVGIILSRYLNSFRSRIIFILIILANTALYSTLDNKDLLQDNRLNVFMIDVGQGESFLIKFPDGETALIDAGNATHYFDNGERIILPLLNRLGIDKIDYGFVSHIDADHYGGFVSLIINHRIKRIFKPVPDTAFPKDQKFEGFLKRMNVPCEYYTNKSLKVGNSRIYILNDNYSRLMSSVSLNNSGGIIKIVYGATSFLFTGDLNKTGERYYLNRYNRFLDTDVLKVGHHGSRSSSSEDFIRDVSPDISLISCGINNRYGHPSDEVISRLTSYNSRIFRTDKEGAVLIQSDGNDLSRVDWRKYY